MVDGDGVRVVVGRELCVSQRAGSVCDAARTVVSSGGHWRVCDGRVCALCEFLLEQGEDEAVLLALGVRGVLVVMKDGRWQHVRGEAMKADEIAYQRRRR